MLWHTLMLGEPTLTELLSGVRDGTGPSSFWYLGTTSDTRPVTIALASAASNSSYNAIAAGFCANGRRSAARFCRCTFSQVGSLAMTTTTEVSDSLERVDSIVNMLDEICDHMDGFSSAEEAWLSSITETLRTWRYVMRETYEGPEESKDD